MTILAIDPAATKPMAWCRKWGGFMAWGYGPWADDLFIDIAIVEDGYIGAQFKQAMDLHFQRGRICERLVASGIPNVLLIQPRVWQAGMLTRGGKMPKGADGKRMARAVAEEYTGKKFLAKENDLADAICMAEWWNRSEIEIGEEVNGLTWVVYEKERVTV